MSLGGSKEKSSSSQVNYGSQIDPTQAGYLNQLWGQGATQLTQGQSPYGQQAIDFGRQAIGQGMGALGGANMQQAFSTLQDLQNPTEVDPMMGAYSNQIGRQFNEQILPGLRDQAQVTGGYGSSRAGIGEGLAAGRMGQQLQDFAAQLYGGQQDRRLNAANVSGQMGMGTAAGYGNFASQGQELGGFGMGIPWYALQQYSGLLGSPAILDKGGKSSSKGSGSRFNIGFPTGGK